MKLLAPMELFERTLRAWDLEVVEIQGEDKVNRKRFHHTPSGTTLKVVWSPEVAADLKAFHGVEAEAGLVVMLLGQVAQALLDLPAP